VSTDLDRLRKEYARRREAVSKNLYSQFNVAHLFGLQQRQRATLQLLQKLGNTNLTGKQILEIGCGSGGILLEYLGYGANVNSLVGIDLLPDRLVNGHLKVQTLNLACADGQQLPFRSGQFDIILQYTAFSSVLDSAIKANLACEMLRVLNAGGFILWYDFWLNPQNPHTKGILPNEILKLFAGCKCTFQKITLAPPLTRGLVQYSWIVCLLLEKLKIFNSHYLVAIRPEI
jgi:ubiquinone/menaquinone biosynthesis C-methylase UbiE